MSSDPTTKPNLSFWQKIAYGIGDIGPALVFTISGFYLNAFLLDIAGLRPAMAGVIFLLVKIWDSVNDPIIGWISDRTDTRWGRRRPWLLFGAIPFGLAWFLQWQVPNLGDTGLFFYYLFVAILLDTAFTAVNIPYVSLTPEIAPNYDERTSLNAYRFSFSLLGGMISLLVHDAIVNAAPSVLTGYTISAFVMGAIIVASNFITFAAIKESYYKDESEPEPGFIEGIKIAFQNRPFLMVTAIYMLAWICIQFVQTNLLLYVRYWMGANDMFIYFAAALQFSIFISLFIWTRLSTRIGKRHVYFIGMAIWIPMQIILFFIQPGQTNFLFILAIIAGIGAGVGYLVPWSMLPDVIDLDELNTNVRREGVYYGFFVLLQKLGISLGLAISNFILEGTGYINAESETIFPEQPDQVLFALRLFVSFVPALILLLSIPIVYKYPLTRQRHQEIQTELATRKEGK